MSYKDDLLAEQADLESQLTILKNTYNEILTSPTKSYKFSSGEGDQSEIYHDPDKIFKLIKMILHLAKTSLLFLIIIIYLFKKSRTKLFFNKF